MIMVRSLDTWTNLTYKTTKPLGESTICENLLNCNNTPSFEEFTILANGNNKFVLEIKKACLLNEINPF